MGSPETNYIQVTEPEPDNEWTRIRKERINKNLRRSISEAEKLIRRIHLVPKETTLEWDPRERLVIGSGPEWDWRWYQASINLVSPLGALNKTWVQIEITANSIDPIMPNREQAESESFLNKPGLSQVITVTNSFENNSRLLNSPTIDELIANLDTYKINSSERQPFAISRIDQRQNLDKPDSSYDFQYSASKEWAGEGVTICLWSDKEIEISYHPQHFSGIDRKNIALINNGVVTSYGPWAEKKFAGLDVKSLAKFNKGSFINAFLFMAKVGLDISNPKVFWNQFSKEAPNFKSF